MHWEGNKAGVTNLLNLAHHLVSLSSLRLGLASQLLVFRLQSLHLLAKIVTASTSRSDAFSLVTRLGLFLVLGDLRVLQARIGVDAPQVLVEILLSREALASVALAVDVGAVELLSRAAVLVVHLALVAEKATRIREARQLLAPFSWALVWAVVLVHMF
jgi:hypothetical protein